MKISFFISSLSSGGAEKVLVTLANEFAARGEEVEIVSLEKREQFYTVSPKVKISKIKSKGKWRCVKDFLAIKRNIKQQDPEVIVSFLSRCNILVLLSMLFTNKTVIVSDRNNPLKEHTRLVFMLQNLIYRRANKVIVQTQEIRSFYPRYIQKKIVVIENPIDTAALNKQIKEMPQREQTILSMGRLEKQKDYKTLIRAFSIISPKHPEWTVKVFGVGEMQKALEAFAKQMGVEHKFLFCGKTATPYLEMRKASIFVLSSFYEGFPNVLCEAMYAGNLCIASNCVSGPKELITDAQNGWLFAVENAEELAEKLKHAIGCEAQLQEIRDAAEKSVEKLYLHKNIAKWEAVVHAL